MKERSDMIKDIQKKNPITTNLDFYTLKEKQ